MSFQGTVDHDPQQPPVFVSLRVFFSFPLHLCPCSDVHSNKPPLLAVFAMILLPSLYLVRVKFSRASFLIVYPKKFSFISNYNIIFFAVPIFLKSSFAAHMICPLYSRHLSLQIFTLCCSFHCPVGD